MKYLLFLSLFSVSLLSQEYLPTSSDLGGLYFRNIGPANQGGRIVDIEADPADFSHVYVGIASGGVWKSMNAGTTWKPIFDDYETASIGDLAVNPKNFEEIWVGTGESNNRNSVSWGNGVYKSSDGGENFENMGLENTHHISRVLVNPEDPDEVCVCATGHLWGYSGDRGMFITRDGGQSWTKSTEGLPNDGRTGCTDLVRDSKDPHILYAAFYHRLRQPWHFHSGGDQGGIFKSTDNGRSWSKLTNGLPEGPTGRIGLAIYEKEPSIVMALVEAERTDDLSEPGSGVYRSENGGESWEYVNTYNNRPFYYSQIRINPHNDQRVYLLTTRFMVSDDGGRTIVNGSEDQEVHGDFHAQWHDPNHPDRYYLGADKGLSLTHDHGAHFQLIDNLPIGQFYRINFDMQDPYYVYGGYQDNGMYAVSSFSRDARGILSDSNWKLHWGDGQYVAVNPFDWRDMYTSMENGTYLDYDPMTHRISRISPGPLSTINFEDHFSDTITDMRSSLRFNWSAPMIMSPHDPSVLYTCGNHVFKSTDKGQSWKIISPDLSSNDPVKRKQGVSGGVTPDNTGAETHCSITTFSVSAVDENVLWAGTDDGLIHVSQDGGNSWTNVRAGIDQVPEGIWVSRIESSNFQSSRAYVTFDGHRSDHFEPWVFVTDDFGANWRHINSGITENEVVRVIREDPVNPSLLFAGTETGVWMSLNRGTRWTKMGNGLPTVSVYDIKIHPRDHDLIIGTHGRSIWIMDDISALQQLDEAVETSFYLPSQRRATLWENVSKGGQRGHFIYAGQNPPNIKNTSSLPRAEFSNTAIITYVVSPEQRDSLELEISTLSGDKKRTVRLSPDRGIQRYYWDLRFEMKKLADHQIQQITAVLQQLIEKSPSRTTQRLFAAFVNASSPDEQRKIVDNLRAFVQGVDFPEEYGTQEAGPGTYKVILRSGDHVQQTSLQIRLDPMVAN